LVFWVAVKTGDYAQFGAFRMAKKYFKKYSDKLVRYYFYSYLYPRNHERMFSKACEYAIKATIFLAARPVSSRRSGLKEISEAISSPEAFTAKILQQMVRKSILVSVKGPNGGFEIEGDGGQISLAQIVEAIDGDSIFKGCALGLEVCSEKKPCPVHHKFKAIRDHLAGMLLTTTIKEVADGVYSGLSFLRLKD
jgi:Rrf2 family transcriptional regulator, iron-sulfur cluster assembly transcription factor